MIKLIIDTYIIVFFIVSQTCYLSLEIIRLEVKMNNLCAHEVDDACMIK